MKKIILLTLSLFLINIDLAYAEKEPLDKIVAVVNDDVVTKSELNRSMTIAKIQAKEQGMEISHDKLQSNVLDDLINKKLQLQIAKQVGIQFTDEDIDRVIKNIAEKNNITVADLYERINHEGMSTNQYRNELKEQMTVQKLQQQEVASHIVVTPDEIKNFMHKLPTQSNAPREVHLEDMLVPLSENASADDVNQAEKQAKTLMTRLNNGEKIDTERNDLGWRKANEIPSVFAQYVANLKANEVAGPIRAANGFHVIRLIADRSLGGKVETPQRDQAEQLLMQQKFQEKVKHWVSKMRSQAFISRTMTS